MLNDLKTYIAQRFGLPAFVGLTIFLMFYSLKWESLKLHIVYLAPVVFLFLFLFRMYDDLMQWEHDKSKSSRDYTNEGTRRSLYVTWLFLLPLLLVPLFLISFETGVLMTVFILINHILYLLFVKNGFLALVLPLIKYPVFVMLLTMWDSGTLQINSYAVISSGTVFMGFLAFESLDDAGFRFSEWMKVLLLFGPFALLYLCVGGNESLIYGLVTFTFFILLYRIGMKYAQYAYLFSLLMFKIYLNTYGV